MVISRAEVMVRNLWTNGSELFLQDKAPLRGYNHGGEFMRRYDSIRDRFNAGAAGDIFDSRSDLLLSLNPCEGE